MLWVAYIPRGSNAVVLVDLGTADVNADARLYVVIASNGLISAGINSKRSSSLKCELLFFVIA